MADGGGEALEGPEELGLFFKDTGKGGSHPKGVKDVFEAVVQAVLFLGAEMWVMNPHIA